MSAIACITTCSINLSYFEKCLDHFILASKTCDNIDIKVVVLDFSPFQDRIIKNHINKHPAKEIIHSYHKNPEFGLCKNLNYYLDIAQKENHRWIFYLNDDSFIHDQFLKNAIMLGENNLEIGFVGGIPQKAGWLANVETYAIPPVDHFKIEDIEDLRKLNWEFSACMFRIDTIKEVGNFDTFFDPIGLCSDNDWLIRAQKIGWRTVRYGGCTFWHGKGVTQIRHRIPGGYDPLKDRAAAYLEEKWNLRINSSIEQYVDMCYDRPRI